MAVLKIGSRGSTVILVKGHLARQGMWNSRHVSRNYTKALRDAVVYFQQTHNGPDGAPLGVDGKVGPNTMWALRNATGPAQRENLQPIDPFKGYIPQHITPERRALLEVALHQHAIGIRERPNGSNRSSTPEGGIDKFLPAWTKKKKKGPAWCAFFVSWVMLKFFDRYPIGRRHGSCKRLWQAAKGKRWLNKSSATRNEPMPGDMFVMLRSNGTGHIGFVLRVSINGTEINTIEGNCGNRVKVGKRSTTDGTIYGYINPFGDDPWQDMNGTDRPAAYHAERRLLPSLEEVGRLGTR